MIDIVEIEGGTRLTRAVTTFLLVTLVVCALCVKIGKASVPTVSVSPDSKTVQVGEQFTINITIDYAANLYGYEFWLSFDNNKLNATAVNYMNYLNPPTNIWSQRVNNTGGYVTLAVSSLFPATGKTGGSPPPLATVDFKSIGTGISPLHLYKTLLSDDNAMPITHQTADSQVIVSSGEKRDVAVTAVEPFKSIVGQGHSLNVMVTLMNQGDITETFAVAAYANTTVVKTKEVTLTSGNSTNLTFTWNTTGFAKGNYTISAVADTVPGETDTADNTLIDDWVIVAMVGDITGPDGWPDGKVDIRDIGLVASKFGAVYPDPRYNANCDLTGPTLGVADGKIDIRDIAMIAKHFGEVDP